jgi:hypothetical protein
MWQSQLFELLCDSKVPSLRPPSLGMGLIRVQINCAYCGLGVQKSCVGDLGVLALYELVISAHHYTHDACRAPRLRIWEKPHSSACTRSWHQYRSDWYQPDEER